jgi:hypothetical protein
MTRGELLEFLTARAKEFRNDTTAICRNEHLTGINEQEMPRAFQIDGTLVAFINYIGMHQGIDYALSVKDLNK